MQKQRFLLALIFALVIAAIAILVYIPPQLGLDLRGGAQLTIQVQPTAQSPQVSPEALDSVKRVIENRINALGVAESLVQTVGQDKVLVQIPGITDPQQAERILGGTAQLEFREQRKGTEGEFQAQFTIKRQLEAQLEILRKTGTPEQKAELIPQIQESLQKSNLELAKFFDSVGLMGKNLKDANYGPTQGNQSWEVIIRFDDDGAKKFATLTKNVAGTGRTLGIFLDSNLISAPGVDVQYATTGITGGSATISGNFNAESSRDLAVQLKGGSLPNPVAVVENRTVGATLGQDSIKSSILAGLGGLILVLIFMGIYYRLPGIIADISLIIYTLLSLACFALVGVTLTLPGIAGFILSIGMAVDANVLIFERTREEIKAGNTLYRAVESGFYRAFSSILDSNVTTLIACCALFWLGSGLVKGFALTLALGVTISMFTAITCSRTLMLLAVLNIPSLRQKPELFCPNPPATTTKS
jgi:preprotein translocase subunit SecD